jgi:hypothetical protein
VYKNDLVRKGLSSEKADALVELAVKGNNLLDEADAAYRAQSEEDAKELARLAKVAEDEAKQWRTQVDTMDSMLNETIRKKDLKVIIPDTEQKDFNQFVRSMVQHDGEAFYIAQKIDPGTLQQVIESLYVQFKKGDLGAIITRKANSLNVKRNQIQLAGTRKKSETPPPAPTNNKLTLGQFRFPGES